MPYFAAGVVRFQKEVFPQKQELFEQLSLGQKPEALFIACSDSRIEPAMITQTDPGELFICRNPGNIIPPHRNRTGAVPASIEFAVSALNVPHVVVCGHTECGAMKAALASEIQEDLPKMKAWLGYAKAAVEVVNELGKNSSPEERALMMLQQNVVLQLKHLETHPSVAARLARGNLQIHGWVYDIRTGSVDAYDQATGSFLPVSEHYADEVAAVMAAEGCGNDHTA